MTNQEIANTITQQLGGSRFMAMTGARLQLPHPAEDGNLGALSFHLPPRFAKDGINYVKVTLTPDDLYDVTFIKIGPRPNWKRLAAGVEQKTEVIAEFSSVFASQLRPIFTSTTGLDLNL